MARLALFVMCALIANVTPALAQSSGKMPPATGPQVVAAPTWTRGVQMPDGRVFVTDGALMVDAVVARPASMPTRGCSWHFCQAAGRTRS